MNVSRPPSQNKIMEFSFLYINVKILSSVMPWCANLDPVWFFTWQQPSIIFLKAVIESMSLLQNCHIVLVAVTEETCGINERPEVRCKVFLKNLEKENNENSNVPYNTVKHGRLYNNEPPYGSCPNESSNLFECTTLGPIKQGRDVVGADSPKNSTCIEGGAAVENAVAAIPFISPIQGGYNVP